MTKLNCNACGIQQASWQRSYKGKWYLQDTQGRPHFRYCPAKPDIPCPKCRQPNRITFQEWAIDRNKTCC